MFEGLLKFAFDITEAIPSAVMKLSTVCPQLETMLESTYDQSILQFSNIPLYLMETADCYLWLFAHTQTVFL